MGLIGSLSKEQLNFFDSNGFLVIESFYSSDEVLEMRNRMTELLDGFDAPSSSSIFSTKNQQQLTDNYFFESAEKISFFFEEKAFGNDGNLRQPKELSINKVGHGSSSCLQKRQRKEFLLWSCSKGRRILFLRQRQRVEIEKALHEIDPIFNKFSNSEKISSIFCSLGYKRPVVIQSMYIFKQPGIGGEVVPHQDNSFLYTEPPSCTGLWLALEDATIINGCLWAIPGSHKDGLVRRFIRDDNGVHFDRDSPSYNQQDFVPLEVKAGSLVVIHGDLIHQSFENKSPTSRHALSLHIVDSDGFEWAKDNWIRRKTAPEPLYVS